MDRTQLQSIMRSWWPTVLAVGCALLTLILGLVDLPGRVDDVSITGWPPWVFHVLLLPTEPYVLLPVLALLAFWCLRGSRRRDALFVVLGPALAVAANTWVLKPLFDRWKGDTLVYPSGHTVSMVATLVVVFVLTGRRILTVVGGAVLLAGVTIGMIGLGYHYPTDVVGGAAFAVFAVLSVRGLVIRRS